MSSKTDCRCRVRGSRSRDFFHPVNLLGNFLFQVTATQQRKREPEPIADAVGRKLHQLAQLLDLLIRVPLGRGEVGLERYGFDLLRRGGQHLVHNALSLFKVTFDGEKSGLPNARDGIARLRY